MVRSFCCFVALVSFVGTGCKAKQERASQPASGEGGRESPSRAEPGASLVVYSGRGKKLIGAALDAFALEHDIKLQIHYGDSAALAKKLRFDSGREGPDVFIAQEVSSLATLGKNGRLAQLPPSLIANVPPGVRGENGRWVALSGRSHVLAYSVRLSSKLLPDTVHDLTSPRWKSKIGWAPENASFQNLVAAMIEVEGNDAARAWLEGMLKNKPRAYAKNTPAVLAISRGEIDAALVNHYYLHRLTAEHGDAFPVANHPFQQGSVGALVELSGAGVLSSAKEQAAAFALLAFLLSPKGQALIIERSFELPVNSRVDALAGMPPLNAAKALTLNFSSVERRGMAVKLLRDLGILD